MTGSGNEGLIKCFVGFIVVTAVHAVLLHQTSSTETAAPDSLFVKQFFAAGFFTFYRNGLYHFPT
jgi:hypothetical protein